MPQLVSGDALVQAVVQGMIAALTFSAILFAVIGILIAALTAVYINRHISDMQSKIVDSVRIEVAKVMRKITANAMQRMGYFEWQQSQLPVLSAPERSNALRTALADTERANTMMNEAGVTDDSDRHLMATIRNNLAWYYAEAHMAAKAEEAKEHARYAARFAGPDAETEMNFLFTKAYVFTVFAAECADAREALWTYDQILSQFGHLPDTAQKVADRRPSAEAKVRQLCQTTQ